MNTPDRDKLRRFLEVLGLEEEPMGMFYTDQEPENGVAPKPGTLPSIEKEQRREVNFEAIWADFSCVLAKILIARKRRCPAYFDRERFGCLGGAFFLGYLKPQLETIVHYVSTGVPGIMEGERYLDSPDACRRFYNEMDPRPAPKRFCVFKPVSQFRPREEPEVVVFFSRPEAISGLHQLATFVTNDLEAVASPFGAGCANILTWPIKYLDQGRLRAVLGGWDPSERRYVRADELTFAVPLEMYRLFLDRWEESFLTAKAWNVVKQKIMRSRKAWGEDKS